jgi:hypothetical protein
VLTPCSGPFSQLQSGARSGIEIRGIAHAITLAPGRTLRREIEPIRESLPDHLRQGGRPKAMTRIFVAIPHYAGPSPGAEPTNAPTTNQMASTKADSRPGRIAALKQVLAWLSGNFSAAVYRLDFGLHGNQDIVGGSIVVEKRASRIDIEIVTVENDRLLSELTLPPWARQRKMRCDPAELAFACHQVLAEKLGDYDWYCFVEDDILPLDPAFFVKLGWFNRTFGDDKLLSPNRYEIFKGMLKVYVDGEGSIRPRERWRFRECPPLAGAYEGRELHFYAPVNPMAGCFFLNGRQMERWASAPGFGTRERGGFNALEAANFLHQRTVFDFYRPALRNADFLEVFHGQPRLSYGELPRELLQKEIAAGH